MFSGICMVLGCRYTYVIYCYYLIFYVFMRVSGNVCDCPHLLLPQEGEIWMDVDKYLF
jgi:hypothetical protein